MAKGASPQAASVPKRSRNAASLRPRTARRNPSTDAIPPPSPALEPAEILDRIGMSALDNQDAVSHSPNEAECAPKPRLPLLAGLEAFARWAEDEL